MIRPRQRRRRQHAVEPHVIRDLAVVVPEIECVAEDHRGTRHVAGLAAEGHARLRSDARVGELPERPLAEVERLLELRDERVLRPLGLHRVRGLGVLRRPREFHLAEGIAEQIVVVGEMLRDVSDRLLRRSRLVAELVGGDRVERLGEVPVERHDPAAKRLRDRVGRIGGWLLRDERGGHA
jgi:hypothetical protein